MKIEYLATKIALSLFLLFVAFCAAPFIGMSLGWEGYWDITLFMGLFIIPLLIPFVWFRKRKIYLIAYTAFILCFATLISTQNYIEEYNASITIDTAPSINTSKYLPFREKSKIVKIKSKTLNFRDVPKKELPVIDGAAAVFPVYSAFVHAVYPKTTRLYEGVFDYNNTAQGYYCLAEKETDIFIGAYPSKDQIKYAKECKTEFDYTQIGQEAFVFFVHKDNPVKSLTLKQIKGIYSGKITNWSEVGGLDEDIVPFQRDEGSGSQSMLIRLMGDTPIIEPDTETRSGGMGMMIEDVAAYKNKTSSIGFSFRYYVESIVNHPDIKMIGIDGVAPNVDNIKSGEYPIIAPVYAVTYKNNKNPRVRQLIDWMLSDEGQYIIEETGYVGIKK